MKAAGHIYLLIATLAFLLLPTCPCEVMALFGIDIHAIHGKKALPLQMAFTATLEEPFFEHCLCDENAPKCAELHEGGAGEAAKMTVAAWIGLDGFHTPFSGRQRSRVHPPPGPIATGAPARALLGVFLI